MTKQWVAHVKDDRQSYEVSVCYGEPSISWGWFGVDKMKVEGRGREDAKVRAEKIAAALNAANFDPS